MIVELYQGEVLGEALFNRMLVDLGDERERYVAATLLQLETETKARLRQELVARGLPVVEDEARRAAGAKVGASLAAMSWIDKMRRLDAGIGGTYLPRYRVIADLAGPDERAVADEMVVHESALLEAVRREAAGDTATSLDPVEALLRFPLDRR